MTEDQNEDKKRYRRYYTPDIFRNVHMLSPFDMLRNLQAELDNAERGHGHYIWGTERPYRRQMLNMPYRFPHAEIYDEGDKLRIAVEIPGSSKEDIELDMEQDHFRISARTKFEKCVENAFFVRCEHREGEFKKEFSLPFEVIPEDAKATYKNDVLEIEVPKRKIERKAKKIDIE